MGAKLRIVKVWIERRTDTDPDLSYIGEYGREATSPDAIDRRACGDHARGEYEWFNPALTGEETGNPDSPRQDYERMEAYNRGEWCSLGIIAKAQIFSSTGVLQTIRSGGLWGVESDSGADELAAIEAEELAGLRAELAGLGLGKRAIDYAFHRVEREEA